MNQVVDVIASIVADVSEAMGTTIHFRHGHKVEVDNLISQLNGKVQDSSVVWPVVWLMHDFPQDETYKGTNCKLTLVIITRTNPAYTAEQRKELVFKPVLVPIYNELKAKIEASKYITSNTSEIKWPRIDHYFYGSEAVMKNENVFSVWTDSIELNGLELEVNLSCDDIDINTPRLLSSWVDVSGNYTYLKFNRLMKIPDDFVDCFLINSSNVETPFSCLDMYHGPTNDLIVFENASRINNEAVVTISTNSVLLLSVDEIAIQAFSGVKVVNYSEYV